MRARRLIVGLAALFLLAGCDFSGTLVIGADDRVTADVTMWIDYGPEVSVDENGNETLMPPRPGCEVLSFPIEGLVGTSEVNAKDPSKVGCRWTGVTTMQALQSTEPAAGFFVQNESRSVVLVSSDFLRPAVGPNPNGPGAPMFDLAVTFPGQVLEHDGASTLSGTTVRWSDTAALSKTGMRVASVRPGEHPSPPLSLIHI